MPAVQCSLCGYVSDTQGKPPHVATKGGWWAHEECVQSCPEVRLYERPAMTEEESDG